MTAPSSRYAAQEHELPGLSDIRGLLRTNPADPVLPRLARNFVRPELRSSFVARAWAHFALATVGIRPTNGFNEVIQNLEEAVRLSGVLMTQPPQPGLVSDDIRELNVRALCLQADVQRQTHCFVDAGRTLLNTNALTTRAQFHRGAGGATPNGGRSAVARLRLATPHSRPRTPGQKWTERSCSGKSRGSTATSGIRVAGCSRFRLLYTLHKRKNPSHVSGYQNRKSHSRPRPPF